jgi:hypothetical protein
LLGHTYTLIIADRMWRTILIGILAVGCGGRTMGSAMPGPDGGASANQDAETAVPDFGQPGAEVAPAADAGPGASPDAAGMPDSLAPDAAPPADLSPDASPPAEVAPPTGPSCADNAALACGPRNERFPWSCIGRPCSSPIGMPEECKPYSAFLGCTCDMPPPNVGPACASPDTTWSVRAQAGIACRTTEDCADRLTDLILCGPIGTCVRANGGRCGGNADCASGFCSRVENTCGGPKGSSCAANRECASYICKDNACK